jgi:hypothetical protein
MEYNNTEFSSDNRETFLTLKNVALKQNNITIKTKLPIERIALVPKALVQHSKVKINLSNNVALKQNDQIKALEFHTQEYQTYLKSLRKKLVDKHGEYHFPDNILCAVNQEIANAPTWWRNSSNRYYWRRSNTSVRLCICYYAYFLQFFNILILLRHLLKQ